MPSTIKIRITDFAKQQGLSVRKFEEICQLGRGNISNMKDDGAIGSDKLSKIIDKFPAISPEWLLTGKGEALKENGKKSENFSDENVPPLAQTKMSPHCREMSPHCVPPTQYDPNDGQAHEFSKGGWSDAQQIEVLNRHIAAQDKVIAMKNDLIRTKDELLASKDELQASKDQTISAQTAALKLLEGQINATTALIEELTRLLGNDAKKRPERADARDVSDVGAR